MGICPICAYSVPKSWVEAALAAVTRAGLGPLHRPPPHASQTNVPAADALEASVGLPPAAAAPLHVRVVPYLDDSLGVAACHEQASHALSLVSLAGKDSAAVLCARGHDGQAGDPIGVRLDFPYCHHRVVCLPVFATTSRATASTPS